MEKINLRFLLSILFPLVVGMTSSFFASAGMLVYKTMIKPPFSPPPALFPLAWTILYLLIGTACYLIWIADVPLDEKKVPLFLYLLQLGMNFFWPIIFFSLSMYALALVWLIAMYIVIIICTGSFFHINPKAGWYMIPYNLWMAFALYLNAATVWMNI